VQPALGGQSFRRLDHRRLSSLLAKPLLSDGQATPPGLKPRRPGQKLRRKTVSKKVLRLPPYPHGPNAAPSGGADAGPPVRQPACIVGLCLAPGWSVGSGPPLRTRRSCDMRSPQLDKAPGEV